MSLWSNEGVAGVAQVQRDGMPEVLEAFMGNSPNPSAAHAYPTEILTYCCFLNYLENSKTLTE
jgi:hypothetical protein